jgi:hypothetical protein
MRCLCLFLIVAFLLTSSSALPLDHVVFRKEGANKEKAKSGSPTSDGGELRASGKILVTDEQGGVLLVSRDGTLRTIEKKDLVSRTSDNIEFKPYTQDEIAKSVLAELPDGFEAYRTANYVICHNTSKAYAAWCGKLFERLHRNFLNFWSRKGFELHEPEFPLVAVVFADQEGYQAYAKRELGDAAAATIGLFSQHTNRITMYDLTSIDKLRRPGDRRLNSDQITEMLSRPDGQRTVATVVHEATHQMAFNCGLHTRYADIPVWVSEGIAVYFETPDLKRGEGWTTIGARNPDRLAVFKGYLAERPRDSLKSLLVTDARFRSAKEAPAAYAEAWALVYHLMNGQKTQPPFIDYLKMLAKKERLAFDTPEDRLREFEAAFGDVGKLDQLLVRAMAKLR